MEEQIPTSSPVRVFHVAAVKVSNQPATLTTAENQNASEQVAAIALNRSTAPQGSATSLTLNCAKRWSAGCTRTIYVGFLQNPSTSDFSRTPWLTAEWYTLKHVCFQRSREEHTGIFGVPVAHNWTKFWTKLGSCNLIVEDPNPSRVCWMRRVADNPAFASV